MLSKGQILAILGLLNGMIGGTILVLPLLAIKTGYILIPCICLLYGLISYYTCYLIVLHLGQCRNIKDVILQHFNYRKSALVIYNLIIGLSLVGVLINYFQLIIKQVQGFIPASRWIGIGVFVVLVLLTIVMRYYSFGERLLAIGIFSIVGYVGFLVWAHITAEHEPNKLSATGPKYIDLAASLIMGYSIHDFVVQVLFKTTTNDKFKKIIKLVYIAGTLIYTFISFSAYAIVNRQPRVSQPQTISQYFPYNSWQVRVIEFLYLFHLLSATPEFCLIMRARFLQICDIQQSQHINIPQLSIYIGLYLLCYLLYSLKVKISTIIQINGSIIGFMYVFLVPIVVHLKCVYFSERNEKGEMIVKRITNNNEQGQNKQQVVESKCKCNIKYKNQYTKFAQLMLQILILVIGAYTIYYTMRMMFWGTEEETKDIEL